MKSRIIPIFCLFACCVVGAEIAAAELSVTNQWRIEQSVDYCGKTNNTLAYPEYWGSTVTDENRETVCLAEQYAQFVALEGGQWLENQGVEFINQCKAYSKGDNTKYFSCLREGLQQVTNQISSSCQELGDEGLWEEDRCRRLVTYIFIKDFDKILQTNRPLIKKLMDIKILKILFNPVTAIVLLLLFVLDIVLLTDPGNWMRVPGFGFLVGTIILASWFFQGELRFIGMGGAVLICVGGIIRNHILVVFKPDKKKGKYLRH